MKNTIRLFLLILITSYMMLGFTFAQKSISPIITKERPADYEYLSAPDSTGKRTLLKMPSLNKAKSTLKLPYPIIFIHGLNSGSYTWDATTDFMDAQYGMTFGGRFDFCLNYDGDNSIANTNFYNTPGADLALYTNPDSLVVGDYYYLNFDVGLDGSFHPNGNDYDVISNQQAIVKQGIALAYAIYYVLQKTGKDKVILMGHSMGGLAAREYLQNWTQADKQHHVAKLVTTGTPHGGSNSSLFGFGSLNGLDEKSEAVRDLRRTYYYSHDSGVYLYGGLELQDNNTHMDDNSNISGIDFYNVDVNCNGIIGETITGLNEKSIDYNIDYACIIGTANIINGGDGVVDNEMADLNNYYPNITKNIFTVGLIHTDLPDATVLNMQGLDEPDNYAFAYHIGFDTTYLGFTTTQAKGDANYPVDFDLYKFTVPVKSNVSASISNILLSNLSVNIVDGNYSIVGSTYHSNGSSNINFSQILNAGDYYFDVFGTAPGANYVVPYNFILTQNCTTNSPNVNAPVTYCQYSTASSLTASGSNLLWYTSESGGTGSTIAPTPSTSMVGTKSYYVSQTINSCESPRAMITVNVIAKPNAPAVISTVTYCKNATSLQLSASGSNLLWYNSATGGTGNTIAPIPSTSIVGTNNYYVSQTVNTCESSRALISVIINAVPSTPNVSSPVMYCKNAISSQLTAMGSNLLWYISAAGGTGSALAPTPSTSIVGTNNYYVSQTGNGCESQRAMISVIVNALPTTPIITQDGKDLVSNIVSGNQWYDSDGIINGATSIKYAPSKDGYYYVIVTENGCESEASNIIHFIWTGINQLIIENGELRVYPNPNDGNFMIEINGNSGENYILKIRNILGVEVFNEKLISSGNKHIQNINLSKLSNGIYQMSLINANTEFKEVFVIEK